MSVVSLTRPVLAALAMCLAASSDPSVAAPDVVPHRAVYDLTLTTGSGRGEVADVSGTMLFEWSDSCDGWSLTQRTAMSFLYQTGEEIDLGWNLATWESKDGLRYRFFVRKLENGELTEEFRGEARLDGPGKGGVAEYTLPEQRSIELPPDTLFPTAHSLKLMERIVAGDTLFWARVFDGSDAEGLFDVSAVVASHLATEAGGPNRSPLLAAGPSARVGLAFYAAEGEAAEPEHEQTLRLHRNGVVEGLDLNFGDFTVHGALKDIKKLPSGC